MQKFAKRLDSLKASDSIAMHQKIKDFQKTTDIIDLTLGQPDFDTPEHIKQAAWKAIKKGQNKYTTSYGIQELREEISIFYRQYYHVGYNPLKEILICPGAKQGIMYLMQSFLNPGDEVLLFEPCWLSYADMIALNEGIAKFIPSKNNLHPDVDRLEEFVSPRTKIIVINNPNNPSGYVFNWNELKNIVEIAAKHDLLIISDEIYDRIVFTKFNSLSQFENERDRIVVVNGFSKTYAMTGWRIGYVLASEKIISKIGLIHQHTATCASSQSQYAALKALTGKQGFVSQMNSEYQKRKDLMLEGITKTKFHVVEPKGTFYIMLDVSVLNVEAIQNAPTLLTKCGIASINGLSYGLSAGKYVRLSLTQNEEQIKETCSRLMRVI